MNWITYCIFTIFLYGVHDIILKHLSNSSNPTLSSIVINLSASVGLLLFFGIGYFWNKEKNIPKTTPLQLLWLIVAGISLGCATITFMKAFASGGNFLVALPFVYVGIILMSVIVGYFFFKETLSVKQIIGISLSLVGIVLVYQK